RGARRDDRQPELVDDGEHLVNPFPQARLHLVDADDIESLERGREPGLGCGPRSRDRERRRRTRRLRDIRHPSRTGRLEEVGRLVEPAGGHGFDAFEGPVAHDEEARAASGPQPLLATGHNDIRYLPWSVDGTECLHRVDDEETVTDDLADAL